MKKPQKIRLECPRCHSTNINTYRMMTGPMWCGDCNFRVETKEVDKSFEKAIKE